MLPRVLMLQSTTLSPADCAVSESTPKTTVESVTANKHSRFLAAWWGSWIGDALAMPAHWYYNTSNISRDYDTITEYRAPKNPHPESILWRSEYQVTGPKDNILHDQAEHWGKPGVHYHQNLSAGENTLNLKLKALLCESIIEEKGYDPEAYAQRYIDFMLSPESHRDTYIEEAHRGFFKNYSKDKPIDQCGIEDSHIGGLAPLIPIILFYHNDLELAQSKVCQHLKLTHKGVTAAKAGELYTEILHYSIRGFGLENLLFHHIGRNRYQALSFPYHRWIQNHTDGEVVGHLVSSACYIEDALPATIYLALRYEKNFKEGLIQNTHLGGDNCHRGALLGAILGAQNGCESIPENWVSQLTDFAKYDQLGDQLWELASNR